MKHLTLTSILFLNLMLLNAQVEDAEGCKDHPLFNRMTNFMIESCSKNYDNAEILVAREKYENREGDVTRIGYFFNEESGQQLPSTLQIVKNYENAILKAGGKKIYSDDGEATFHLKKPDMEYWVTLNGFYTPQGNGISNYWLIVTEMKPMVQEIQANEMFDAISKDGFIALDIHFDTGKSVILPESQGTVAQIAQMLKANPSLKVSIEGHTDNVGSPESNKTLSESRANSVVESLVAQGIDRSRLTAKGWGQDKPVADNRTEDGRAKNRRVEIVKA